MKLNKLLNKHRRENSDNRKQCDKKLRSEDRAFCNKSMKLIYATFTLSLALVKGQGKHVNVNPCIDNTNFTEADFCDITLPIDLRIADILDRMTLSEKIDNLGTTTQPTDSLGLPFYKWWR